MLHFTPPPNPLPQGAGECCNPSGEGVIFLPSPVGAGECCTPSGEEAIFLLSPCGSVFADGRGKYDPSIARILSELEPKVQLRNYSSVEQIQDRVEIFDFGEGSFIVLGWASPNNNLAVLLPLYPLTTFLYRQESGTKKLATQTSFANQR